MAVQPVASMQIVNTGSVKVLIATGALHECGAAIPIARKVRSVLRFGSEPEIAETGLFGIHEVTVYGLGAVPRLIGGHCILPRLKCEDDEMTLGVRSRCFYL